MTERHEVKDTLSTNKDSSKAIIKALENLANASANQESIQTSLRDHKESFYVKPESRSYAQAAEVYTMAAAEEKEMATFTSCFDSSPVKPWDGAYLTAKTLFELYGYGGFGKAVQTMFGKQDPQTISVPISTTETVEVPWGLLEVPDLQAVLQLGSFRHEKYGSIFSLTVQAPKKMQDAVKGLFIAIEHNIRTKSLYKGKCITSDEMPKFLDPYAATNRDDIIFSAEVDAMIRGSLTNVIRFTDRARERGITVKRSVMLYGDPGNGKSETANIIAQEAMESTTPWTYIFCQGDLMDALRTARLYAPAILLFEDVETLIKDINPAQMKELLEEFDGSTTKGHELLLIGTTNFIGDLYQPFRRRFYKEIEFTPLDHDGRVRFLMKKLADEVDPNMDYGVCASAMDGWGNSYISKALDFARSLALENVVPRITTDNLLDAITATRSEWESYLLAKARPEEPTFERAFSTMVQKAVEQKMSSAVLLDNDDDQMGVVSF